MLVNINKRIVVLGTGGTIAGTSGTAGDNLGYTAAQVGVTQLLGAIPALSTVLQACAMDMVSEQVAQVDSKDMGFAIWQRLTLRVAHHLAQPDVRGVLITHGTDTLEETAFFLHSVLPPTLLATKPVVLTCAMRRATALAPDGPQNVLDAVAVILTSGAAGVMAVCAGAVHSALDVQKTHTYRVDAFGSGDAGPLGYVEEGCVRWVKIGPEVPVEYQYVAIEKIANLSSLPWVEIVTSHAEASVFVAGRVSRLGAFGTALALGKPPQPADDVYELGMTLAEMLGPDLGDAPPRLIDLVSALRAHKLTQVGDVRAAFKALFDF